MGTNILFWNCQGIRPKCKEIELYLKENVIDFIALNETFLSKKHNLKIPGLKEGVAFLVKNGLVVNKEHRNEDFNIITNNEALAIELELSNNKASLWIPFTVQMEILTFHFFNILTIYLIMSCLSEISTGN